MNRKPNAILTPTTRRNELARDPRTADEVPAYRAILNGNYIGVYSSPAFSGDRAAEALRLAKNHAASGRQDSWTWVEQEDGTVHGWSR
ncbi:hypothetical protein [Aquisalimonas sp.]|uniref:hypothetical protein n=1 Tax=Aquisalimonas sp. TaxID=1872621 RepID=UPI0025C2D439|nr:hypothetical protein [Aquisalimonas sp.]